MMNKGVRLHANDNHDDSNNRTILTSDSTGWSTGILASSFASFNIQESRSKHSISPMSFTKKK